MSGDAGLSHLRQAGIPESNALTLGGEFDANTDRTFVRTSLLSARADSAGWTGQAVAFGGITDPSLRVIRWGLSGALSAFSQSNTRPTTTGELAASLQTGTSLLGASLAGGGGFSAHARDVTPVRRLSGETWWGLGAERVDLGVELTHTRQQRFLAPSFSATYADATAAWRHERGGVSLGAVAGYRAVSSGNLANGSWASGDATLWVAPRTAVVLSVGQTLADVVRGFPRATYATIALRLTSRPHATVYHRAAAGPRIAVAREADGGVAIEVRAPRASSVELAADFTGWLPISLQRSGDDWRIVRAAAAGSHRVMIRIDGGPWTVPPNVPKVDDDLGVAAGVIIIP
jgi:hypothetical protein